MTEWRHEQGLVLTDDPARADVDAIHRLLSTTYWGATRSRDAVAITIASSLTFSLLRGGRQVGVARVLTDLAATSYLCDVVIEDAERSAGLGRWMMERILQHPSVRGTRVLLLTRDAGSRSRSGTSVSRSSTGPSRSSRRSRPSGRSIRSWRRRVSSATTARCSWTRR